MTRKQFISFPAALIMTFIVAVPLLFGQDAAAPEPAGDAATPIESRIVHVTVYPQWAYVVREATVDLKAGQSTLGLNDLPSWIDDESIRVNVGGNNDINIIGAGTKTTYLARTTEEKIRQASEAVTRINDQIEDLNSELSVLEQEKKYLQNLNVFSLSKVPHDAAVRAIDVDEMKAVKDYVTEASLENVKKMTAIRRRIREMQPELDAASKRFNELRGQIRLEKKQIVVDLEAAAATRATVQVSYLISGASWHPVYDARTTRVNGEIILSAQAVVQQSTGEDWSDASFVLSTIQPELTREIPELKPWFINQRNAAAVQGQMENPRYAGSPNQRRLLDVQKKFLYNNTIDIKQQEAWGRVQGNVDNFKAVIKVVESRGTTVEFEIAGKFAVKPNGEPTRMPIGTVALDAMRQYTAVPAVSKSTYVTGRMRNTATFPLLPGLVRIFRDGSFIGKSDMPFVAQSEKFDMFLGLEERIKVTRKLNYSKSSLASFSSKKRMQVAYDIEVRNYLGRPAEIVISDQIPVSQDKAVEVKLLDVEPRQTVSEDKGILTWPIRLESNGLQKIFFEYRVEYPNNVVLEAVDALEQQILAN